MALGANNDDFDARQRLMDLGVDLGLIRSWAGMRATAAAEFGEQQAVISQLESVQKLIAIGLPAAGLLVGSAWGVAHVAERLSGTWPVLRQLSDAAKGLQDAMQGALAPMISVLEEVSFSAGLVHDLQQAWLNVLPENLRGINGLDLTTLSQFLSGEGIPLYLIPRQSTAEAFLAAPSHRAARSLLNTRAESLIEDCRTVWKTHRTAATQEWIHFLEAGLDAYTVGHTAAAQALFANVMDSIGFALPRQDRSRYTTHHKGNADVQQLLNEEVATALAMLPLWQVHEANFESHGDVIPRGFNRHATLHRVSARQYCKRNAIQAMMLATSLLAWFADYAPGPSD